jgi:hypothetical protein
MNSGNKQEIIFKINFHSDVLASVFIWKSCLSVIPKANFLILFYFFIYHYQSQANLYHVYERSLENFSVLVKSGSCYSP